MAASGSDSEHLEEDERAQVARFEPLRATGIHEILRKEGESELERALPALLWTGLAAGLSMGFSFSGQALLHSGLPDLPWRHLVASFGYAIGFVIIVMGRQQLYTESTLTAVLPVLTRRDRKTAMATLRLWGSVLAANITGTWLFAAALAYGEPFGPDVAASLRALAGEVGNDPFGTTVFKGIFAGWLIALMVWLLPSARTAKLWVIILITYLVALARLPHIIAGSAEVACAVLTGIKTPSQYWLDFFVPTLIGNSLGGVCLVAMLNHAPIAPELEGKEEKGSS
ncbi:formate/nitrite transporter family protein [Sphingomonas sp.]|uniref:formate/nitrite transporter family protein n=1 Tax=Sphingomonas sp. TaxID=28214 RepID=UPI003B3A5C32